MIVFALLYCTWILCPLLSLGIIDIACCSYNGYFSFSTYLGPFLFFLFHCWYRWWDAFLNLLFVEMWIMNWSFQKRKKKEFLTNDLDSYCLRYKLAFVLGLNIKNLYFFLYLRRVSNIKKYTVRLFLIVYIFLNS